MWAVDCFRLGWASGNTFGWWRPIGANLRHQIGRLSCRIVSWVFCLLFKQYVLLWVDDFLSWFQESIVINCSVSIECWLCSHNLWAPGKGLAGWSWGVDGYCRAFLMNVFFCWLFTGIWLFSLSWVSGNLVTVMIWGNIKVFLLTAMAWELFIDQILLRVSDDTLG